MRQKSETIFFSIIVRLTFFVTGLHPSRKHTFSIVSFHDNLPLLPIDRTPDIIKIKTPPQPVVYPVPRVRDIYSNSRGYTDNFLLDISVHVKDQVNIVTGQDREKEKREREKCSSRFAIINLISLAQSREKVVGFFSRAFIGSNRSIGLDLSHSSRAIGQSFVRVAGVKGWGGRRGGRLYDSPLYFPVFQGGSNTDLLVTRSSTILDPRSD